MNICFILPGQQRKPVGGYKIVFEYANRLYEKGIDVTILFLNKNALQHIKLPLNIKRVLINLMTKIEPTWFKLNKNIKKVSALEKDYLKKIDSADVYCATAITTYNAAKSLFPNKKKLFFIQGYETWMMPQNYIHDAFGGDMINIVVSGWLKQIVDKYSKSPSILIRNAIDPTIFRPYIPIEKRKNHTISCLYHSNPVKGTKYLLQTLYKLKEMYNDLEVEMFGIPKVQLPKWIHYTRQASQKKVAEIYNKTQIFLCTSIEEGYGLTGLEAMASGSVLISTNYSGATEYAIDERNSLLSPVCDTDALVKNVSRVFDNNEFMLKLSQTGVKDAQNLSWNKAIDKFLKIIY